MKKKLLAFVCILALVVGVFAVGATATTQQNTYQVGYAKVDVSPWIKDYPSATNMTDDNGNAIGFTYDPAWEADYADYLKTISVVADTKSGKATDVGFLNAEIGYSGRVYNTVVDTNGDNLRGKGDGIYSTATTVTDSNGNTVVFVTIDAIGGYQVLLDALKESVVAGINAAGGNLTWDRIYLNASHSHRGIDLSRLAQNKVAPVQAYWAYYKQMVTDAAVSAYVNRTAATMSKGQVDVSDAVGHQMNFIRHYNTDKVDVTTGKTIIRGSNFGGSAGNLVSHVYEADDMLYLLQFTPTNGDTPIVLMNWRAHGTMVGKSDALSGDHIGAIRSTMEKAGYRFVFLQGAAGNAVPRSAIEKLNTWKTEKTSGYAYSSVDKNTTVESDENQVNHYGYLMTKAAKACLNNHMQQLTTGEIRTITHEFITRRQKETAAQIEAALLWHDLGEPTISGTYSLKGEDYQFPGFPWIYTSTSGETAIFDSQYHVLNVYLRNSTEAGQAATHNGLIRINAMMLGDEVAMVTCGNEISDRYSATDELLYSESKGWYLKDNDNDWKDLYSSVYGTPFVLGYTNGDHAYMSNYLSYTYNQGSNDVAGGCYESETSKFDQGTGEEMIVKFNDMLGSLRSFSDHKTADCPACGSSAEWFGINQYTYFKLRNNPNGHYYLTGDISTRSGISLAANATLCFDLNGHTLENTASRVFSLSNDHTSTLNLLDSVGTGAIITTHSSGMPQGGIAMLYGTCNIYGGNYSHLDKETEQGTAAGGLFAVQQNAHLNLYGGTFTGANLSAYKYGHTAKDGYGAAIYLYSGGNLLVGGNSRLISGTVPAHGAGICVAAHDAKCKITLQGNAKVDDIYFPRIGDYSLTVSGAYTGIANVQFGADVVLTDGRDIGNSDHADLSGATITCVTNPKFKFLVSGSNLILQRDPVAYIGNVSYSLLQDALNAAQEGQTVKLVRDIADEEITVPNKAITIDLNGCDILNASATGSAVTFKDSKTDDFDVSDGVYGKISGNAVAADGYMAVTEADGISFHKVNLNITAMSLRASAVGVYYKSNFQADEVAAKAIKQYGVALNVKGEPNETNMGTTSAYSYFTKFTSGEATGTLLKNIMKTSNTDANNNRNANMAIYGRAYVLTTDGQYIFGKTVQRSLKELLEAADTNWTSYSDATQKTVLRMYKLFKSTMDGWNIPNIKEAGNPADDGIMKVLIVGNSHGLDSTNLLCEVFKDQGMKAEDFVVGALYTSGCRMDQHADFMTNNKTYYSYHENGGPDDTNGIAWTVIDKPTPNVPFDRHQWDIVIMQQMNHRAGVEEQYVKEQFETVLNYIDNHQIGTPKLGWQMIWANPDNYETYLNDDSPLKNPDPRSWRTQHEAWYGTGTAGSYNSINMYNKVVACTQKFITDSSDFLGEDYFDFVIPAATTIQYARDILGYELDQLYRDYTHLSDFGRLLSAYTWYGKIVECVDGVLPTVTVNMTEFPAELHVNQSTYPAATDGKYYIDQTMRNNIATAVNWALQHPYELPAAQ